MSRTGDPDQPAAETDIQRFVRDWVTIWQSELAGLAADGEAQEGWRRLLGLWASFATPPHDGASGRPGAAQPPWPAAAAAAPDASDAAIERLSRRVAELEARLAELERDRSRPGGRRAGTPRPPR